MSFKDDFKAFITRGNVVDMAIAVVVGGAFGKIVTAFVQGIIMPAINILLPGSEWHNWALGPFQVGTLLGAIVDFLLISLAIFIVLVKGLNAINMLRNKVEPAPTTKTCPYCLETVQSGAKKCKFCTSDI
jgi:large conductance mechanosensitive channel